MKKGLESLINAVTVGLREKNDFPTRWCSRFSDNCIEKFKQYGETGVLCEYKCEYCEKFKWIIDRAKHYAEKVNIPYEEILEGWENDRNYWFLNYYQECNQPKFDGNNIFVFETMQEYIDSLEGKGYYCPKCGAITPHPFECKCGWKSYGLFKNDLVTVYVKEKTTMAQMFMPVAWQNKKN